MLDLRYESQILLLWRDFASLCTFSIKPESNLIWVDYPRYAVASNVACSEPKSHLVSVCWVFLLSFIFCNSWTIGPWTGRWRLLRSSLCILDVHKSFFEVSGTLIRVIFHGVSLVSSHAFCNVSLTPMLICGYVYTAHADKHTPLSHHSTTVIHKEFYHVTTSGLNVRITCLKINCRSKFWSYRKQVTG